MKKQKETLQQQLLHRTYKKPVPVFNWFYKLVMCDIQLHGRNVEIHYQDDPRKEKGACFILWNHLSRFDHSYIQKVMYPHRFNMVAGYCEFFRSHLAFVFKMQRILPKKNFCVDVAGIKAILSIIKQGGAVSMAPEGLATVTGMNEQIIEGVGKLIKHAKCPVYFARFEGQSLVAPVFSSHYRDGGKSEVTVFRMFTKEEAEEMSPKEIEAKIGTEFSHNDYEYQEKNRFKWNTKGFGCEGMEDICYKCPCCGEELHMHSHGDDIKCDACGFEMHCNEYLELLPNREIEAKIKYPSDWVILERKDIIKQIRENKDFTFSFKTSIGLQPGDHYVKSKTRATEIVGDGVFTMTHEGMRFEGVKHGEPYSFDLSYKSTYRFIFEVNTRSFGIYIDGEFMEFTPYENVAFKADLICSEMNRLHFDTWKPVDRDKHLYE